MELNDNRQWPSNPSVYLDNDRAKAQPLGLNISDVFTALQATLGGIYVNNFNPFGHGRSISKAWQLTAATSRTFGRSMSATARTRWRRSDRSPA